jgi:hypothetical protein
MYFERAAAPSADDGDFSAIHGAGEERARKTAKVFYFCSVLLVKVFYFCSVLLVASHAASLCRRLFPSALFSSAPTANCCS